jgi:hypothetical protein
MAESTATGSQEDKDRQGPKFSLSVVQFCYGTNVSESCEFLAPHLLSRLAESATKKG